MLPRFERFIVKSVAENAPDGLLSDIESHQKHGAEGGLERCSMPYLVLLANEFDGLTDYEEA